ncbi:MAG TPA: hypothetical protein VL096_08360 [Pirellulaceae bacterium]|nr:hypothetical protein [Pirellulaceae bacterium]
MNIARRQLLLLIVLFLALSGCSQAYDSQVSGEVALDGKPLTLGTITFHPLGDGPLAYGQIDAAGKFALSTGANAGLKPGDYVVTIVATGPPPSDMIPGALLTPAKYGSKDKSDLKATVVAGKNHFKLEMKSP